MERQDEKVLVGEAAVIQFVKDGMTVGLGTGSTAYYVIKKMGEMIKKGVELKGVATSKATEKLASECGIQLIDINEVEQLDIAIDGADEIDDNFFAIKGGGGALLREKIIASAAKTFIVVADGSKKVQSLGKFPLPIEVVPFGYKHTEKAIRKFGCKTAIRQKDGKLFVTDNGNYIIDCSFPTIQNPTQLHQDLNNIVGVVENGLFINMVDVLISINEQDQISVEHKNR
ncbi:ribose 5-phosphate isomerase A [Niallia circulans]|uniref:ribose-5-phosphate isomerase RpiA n=1 Tax=Niallia circulans TaxID=1397 RepID=UPI0002DBA734|nr:ribose-5-phosphate isomerase RpiA [Niallia circulans]AYV67818.1 ribose 5-phosphate isomerase A [Niallia circulans]NRG26383.1 ribose-5-phosphate isomerase RpiA [Niallia circulans]QJX63734.1 ribose-5-phosphate isomerase RpiA [Niallia circulans]UQZ76138.1 ribose 5-phosphate isomerase A [Niallia circulans]